MYWRLMHRVGSTEQIQQGKGRGASVSKAMRSQTQDWAELRVLGGCEQIALGGGTDQKTGMGHAFVMEEDGQTGSTAACETFASPVRHHPRLARAVLSSGLRLTVCYVCVGQALLEAKDGRTRRPDEIITFGAPPCPPSYCPAASEPAALC